MTIKLGVLALAGPDNGGTYQYTLSMLQALQHTSGLRSRCMAIRKIRILPSWVTRFTASRNRARNNWRR